MRVTQRLGMEGVPVGTVTPTCNGKRQAYLGHAKGIDAIADKIVHQHAGRADSGHNSRPRMRLFFEDGTAVVDESRVKPQTLPKERTRQ
jgi:hypothetical protein